MIRSMTGYGQATAELPEARITVECRSVNHRYADLRLRLPAELADREADLRRRILTRIRRGRVEVTVSLSPVSGKEPTASFNRQLAEEVLAAADTLRQDFDVPGSADMACLLRIAGMFRTAPSEVPWDPARHETVDRVVVEAVDALDGERRREGEHLRVELGRRSERMVELVAQLRTRAVDQPANVRDRLSEKLQRLEPEIRFDPARVAQEVALLAERSDVTEELVRLEGHVEQARRLIGQPDGKPVGRRLDFLMQEIHRETNTVNSKSSSLELSRAALELKAEIEKVREQVQNLE